MSILPIPQRRRPVTGTYEEYVQGGGGTPPPIVVEEPASRDWSEMPPVLQARPVPMDPLREALIAQLEGLRRHAPAATIPRADGAPVPLSASRRPSGVMRGLL